MDFINEQVHTAAIPDATQVNWQPVEKDYLKVLRIQWMIISAVLLIAAVLLWVLVDTFKATVPMFCITVGWVVICGFYFFVMEKSFHQLAYAVREHDILYRRGWIVQSMIACPFNRIQHCSADAGLLDRKYNLSSLTLFTAGASGADVRIPGLKEADAQKLREFILQKIKADEQTAG